MTTDRDDELHAHGCREVEDGVALRDGDLHGRRILDRVADEPEALVPGHAAEVLRPPGGEVVKDRDRVPLPQQALGQVRADEPGPAGNQVTLGHADPLLHAVQPVSNTQLVAPATHVKV